MEIKLKWESWWKLFGSVSKIVGSTVSICIPSFYWPGLVFYGWGRLRSVATRNPFVPALWPFEGLRWDPPLKPGRCLTMEAIWLPESAACRKGICWTFYTKMLIKARVASRHLLIRPIHPCPAGCRRALYSLTTREVNHRTMARS